MASRWFYRVGGQEVGPVTFQEMAQLVRDGRLTDGDRVRREISNEWIAAREGVCPSGGPVGTASQLQGKCCPGGVPCPSLNR